MVLRCFNVFEEKVVYNCLNINLLDLYEKVVYNCLNILYLY